MALEDLGPVPPDMLPAAPASELQDLGPVPEADWAEVLGGVPERAGLRFIQAGGGAARLIGDFLGSESLAELGAEVHRTASGALRDETPANMTLGQEVVGGGLESALTMLPALALAPISAAAIAPAGVALAAGTTGASRYGELREEGFGRGRAAFHAGVDAFAEGLGEKVALPVLADVSRPLLNRFYSFLGRDLAGEEFTTIVQQGNAMLSDRPDMTWGEFLQGMAMTALVTPVAAGAQFGTAAGLLGAKAALTPSAEPALPSAPPAPVPAPPAEIPPTATPAPPGPTADGGGTPTPTPTPPGPDSVPAAPGPTPTPPKPLGQYDQGWNQSPDIDGLDAWWHTSGGKIGPSLDPSGAPGPKPFALFAPNGVILDFFDTPADAAERAESWGWNTPLEQGFSWAPDMTLHFQQSATDQAWVVKPPTKESKQEWRLYTPDGNQALGVVGDAKTAQKRFKDFILKKGPPVAVPPPVTQPPATPPIKEPRSLLHSPAGTLHTIAKAENLIDPRLWHRVHPSVSVSHDSTDKTWTVMRDQSFAGIPLGPISRTFDSPREAVRFLEKLTGISWEKLNPQQFDAFYRQGVLNWLIDNPKEAAFASPEVRDYFGKDANGVDHISEIGALGMERKIRVGQSSGGGLVEGFGAIHFGELREDLNILKALGAQGLQTLAGDDLGVLTTDQMRALPPGIYLPQSMDPTVLPALELLERLRKEFTPNIRIYLRPAINESPSMVQGGTAPIIKDGYVMELTDILKLRGHMKGSFLTSTAHEFGHITLYEHLRKAPPEVFAKLVRSWLKYTEDLGRNTPVVEYFARHHWTLRGPATNQQVVKELPSKEYFLSFSEYLADQASHYFLQRDARNTQYSAEEKAWYDQLIDMLQKIWNAVKVHFLPNQDYIDFLDGIAGGPNKASSGQGPSPGPGPKPKDIKKKPPIKIPLNSPQQVDALMKKKMKLWNELVAAGATKEEMEAIFVQGMLKEFDWNAAFELADKYGIHPRWYDGKTFFRTIDDTTGFRQDLHTMIRALPDEELRSQMASSTAAVKSFNWFLQKTMTAVQLRKRFGGHIPGVKQFVDNLEKMFAYRSRWKERADDRIKEMQDTPKAERDRVFDLLLAEDREGNFRSTITQDAVGNRVFTLLPEVAKEFRLSEKGVALYAKLRGDFHAALIEMEMQAEAELRRLYTGPGLIGALGELRDAFDAMKAKPYVPHTRFGEHTVSVRSAEGALIEFYQFESERDAKAMETRRRKELSGGEAVSRGKLTEQQRLMMGLPPQLIRAMRGQLNLTPEQIAAFEDVLKDMSNAASFVRRFKRRKDIAGWEDDADNFPRAYADYMSRFANHVSRIKYNHILSDAVAGVRQQAKDEASMGLNTVELNDLGNWLERLHRYVNDPGEEFTAYRAAATIWYLGLNVKSALVNSTSVPLVTFPYLSKRFGSARALAVIGQAYKDVARMYLRPEALSQDERKMFEHLRSKNKVDQSFASELAGLREGGRLSDQYSLTKWAANFYGIKYYSMWLFQKVEVVNRMVTALSAYRLQRNRGNFDPTDTEGFDQRAADFASSSIDDTQNENAQWNRSELMRGRKSILTMFMSYQQNLIYQMFGGDQSWMRLLAAQMLIAGMMGIPFAKDLDELIKWFAREVFGSDWSAEKAARAVLKDIGANPEWFIRGASHNVFGLDLSGSLSQGRVIPGIDALAMEGDFADRLANAASDVGGAGFAIILNMMKAASSNDPDVWKRASRMIPEFARSAAEGAEMLANGRALDAQGRMVARVTDSEAAMRALGFQITSVTTERGKRFAQKDSAAFWMTRRAYVLSMYEKAMNTNDPKWRKSAMEALRDFNREAPNAALRITSRQITQSMRRRQAADRRYESGRGPSRTQESIYRDVGKLYGE